MNLKIRLFLIMCIQFELLKEIRDHIKNVLTFHENYM